MYVLSDGVKIVGLGYESLQGEEESEIKRGAMARVR
jgi:hypothetical protein